MTDVIIRPHNDVHSVIDCEPGVANELNDYFTFSVPNAKFSPAFKNKVWDGKIRLFNRLTHTLYCGLSEHVEQFCTDYKYNFIDSTSRGDVEFSLFEGQQFIDTLGMPLEPRQYQLEAFVDCVRKRRRLIVSPTASGKSLLIYVLCRYYNKKTLIIVPSIGLVTQMSGDFVKYGYNQPIHQITAGVGKDSGTLITISTWQSIYKQPRSWFDQFDVIIGDECHLFAAKSLLGIMHHTTSCKHKFGFTGSLDESKTNKLVLEGLFGPLNIVTTTAKLMADKHVAELMIKVIVLRHDINTNKVITSSGDYQTEYKYLIESEARNRFICNLAASLATNTLVLFRIVDQGNALLAQIKQTVGNTRPVYFIDGKVDGEQREHVRQIIDKQTNAIIVASYGTTSTGINIPNINNIIFASPSKSRVRNLQSIGRGLRLSGTKTSVTLFDIGDDMSVGNRINHTMRHMIERIKLFTSEQFTYKVYNIDISAKSI